MKIGYTYLLRWAILVMELFRLMHNQNAEIGAKQCKDSYMG